MGKYVVENPHLSSDHTGVRVELSGLHAQSTGIFQSSKLNLERLQILNLYETIKEGDIIHFKEEVFLPLYNYSKQIYSKHFPSSCHSDAAHLRPPELCRAVLWLLSARSKAELAFAFRLASPRSPLQ